MQVGASIGGLCRYTPPGLNARRVIYEGLVPAQAPSMRYVLGAVKFGGSLPLEAALVLGKSSCVGAAGENGERRADGDAKCASDSLGR